MVVASFFDEDVLESLVVDDFRARRPFPWHNFSAVLTPLAFDSLLADFPPRALFEWREGYSGQHYDRPHNRWYLEYQPDQPSAPGSVQKADLPEVWQRFIDEIETNGRYRELMTEWLDLDDCTVRMTWHLGVTGSEVSPHIDSDNKVGTHIFYFNTLADWEPTWGGNLLVLDGVPQVGRNLEFDDFASSTEIQTLGNRSFLFKNNRPAWHGVPPLTCPDGHYRRLFNVVYERTWTPVPRKPLVKRLRKRLVKQLHG